MRRRVVALGALVAAATLALSASPAPARRTHCAPARSHTVMSNRFVRVYSDIGREFPTYWGCLRRTGRTIRLTYAQGMDRVFERRALNGTWVAWTTTNDDTPFDSTIGAVDLRTSRRRQAVVSPYANDLPDAIAVSDRGVLAWLEPDALPSYAPGASPSTISTARFGNDPRPRLALARDNGVWALRQAGDGNWTTTKLAPTFGIVTDVTDDGISDVVTLIKTGVALRAGKPDAIYAAPTTIPVSAPPSPFGYDNTLDTLAAGDVNDDGHVDLVLGGQFVEQVYVVHGRGAGAFDPPVAEGPHLYVPGLGIADVDGDAISDVVVWGDPLAIVRGQKDGPLRPAISVPDGFAATVADLDRDGIPDLVLPELYGFDVLHGRGFGAFSQPMLSSRPGGLASVVATDVNGDGIPDLIAGEADGPDVEVFDGHGDLTFAAPREYRTNGHSHDVVVADFNGDDKPDIATLNTRRNSFDVSILNNLGNGTFQTTTPADDVMLADGSRRRELAHDQPVTRGSLRFHGTTLSWTANGQRHTITLPAPHRARHPKRSRR